jgi:hypothetical protein
MTRPSIKDMMAKRNPLSTLREAIQPANLYSSEVGDNTPKQDSDLALKHLSTKDTNSQSAIDTKIQSTLAEKNQSVKDSMQVSTKTPKQQKAKKLKHFSSYLTVDSFRKVKMLALQTDRKDYEVLQEAVDALLEKGSK